MCLFFFLIQNTKKFKKFKRYGSQTFRGAQVLVLSIKKVEKTENIKFVDAGVGFVGVRCALLVCGVGMRQVRRWERVGVGCFWKILIFLNFIPKIQKVPKVQKVQKVHKVRSQTFRGAQFVFSFRFFSFQN